MSLKVSYHGRARSKLGRTGEAIFNVVEDDKYPDAWVWIEDDEYLRYGFRKLCGRDFIGEPDSDKDIRWVRDG